VSTTAHRAFPADGISASWSEVESDNGEHLRLDWENEAWTAAVRLDRDDVEVVVRLSPLWQVRQCLLFRDLDEPDLWLGTDGRGHWGEVNGVHRPELDGATDVALVRDGVARGVFAHLPPVRRMPVDVGGSFDVRVLAIDVETLAVDVVLRTYRKVDETRWEVAEAGVVTDLTVDDHGLPVDVDGRVRRV
jgi:hypothetical protein